MDPRRPLREAGEPDEVRIVCPNCGEVIPPAAETLWTLLGKWYCSEGCVRAWMKK